MISGGISAFSGRRILLLQGPVGPFFARLACDLREAGAEVRKINFHGGDWLFQPDGTTFRGTMAQWPDWLTARLVEWRIDLVLLFGDCRPVHRAAREVLSRMGVAVGVFEEGYLRPDFITLERHGVNGHSLLPQALGAWPHAWPELPEPEVRPMPRSFWPMVLWGFLYFAMGGLSRPWFRHYRHHRPLQLSEAIPWLRSPLRKAWFAFAESGMTAMMTGAWSGRFFLVPLQVHTDAQVHAHADVGGVEGFIAATIASFARAAPADALLVFKHHPMDRGYCDHSAMIARLAEAAGCHDRIHAIHDQHMPTILPHCRGVVVINSTAGLAAIGAGKPTIALGRAIYALPGLAFRRPIDRFWSEAETAMPDPALYRRFRNALIATTQINGNFYRRLDRALCATGLVWHAATEFAQEVAAPEPASNVVPFPLKGSNNADRPAALQDRALP